MSFLDLNLRRQNNKLEISIFRKATFTGLGLSFFSFIPSTVKKSVVVSAVTRAFRLTSSYQLFDCELNFLRKVFQNNGFPKQLIESVTVIRYVLDKVFLPRVPTSLIVRRLEKYFVLPYFGAKSSNLQKDIIDLLVKYYPFLSPKIVLRNRFNISSLFHFQRFRFPNVIALV